MSLLLLLLTQQSHHDGNVSSASMYRLLLLSKYVQVITARRASTGDCWSNDVSQLAYGKSCDWSRVSTALISAAETETLWLVTWVKVCAL